MIVFLDTEVVIEFNRLEILRRGGVHRVLDYGLLDSAVTQPQMGFGGQEFYPTVPEKAAALAYSLIMNHAFEDGNKRTGHTAMLVFLRLNRHELSTDIAEDERVIISVASGELSREEFTAWVCRSTRSIE
ncbi:MAG: type II toxin-antitoxin system death-on-curing family toxin [Planctomycetota bacterium]